MKAWLKGGLILGLLYAILFFPDIFFIGGYIIPFIKLKSMWLYLVTGILFWFIMGIIFWSLFNKLKENISSTKKGLIIGLILSIAIFIFMLYECNLSRPGENTLNCVSVINGISNFGYFWMGLLIVSITFIGWIIGKIKSKKE